MTTYHEPALLNECIEALDIKPDGVYVDVEDVEPAVHRRSPWVDVELAELLEVGKAEQGVAKEDLVVDE